MNPEESFQQAGQTLCEDCYMDVMTAPKACDPWVVHTAKDLAGKEFTLMPTQQKVLDLITNNALLPLRESATNLARIFHESPTATTKLGTRLRD